MRIRRKMCTGPTTAQILEHGKMSFNLFLWVGQEQMIMVWFCQVEQKLQS